MQMPSNELYEGLSTIPLFDIHTHMDASHLSARGLQNAGASRRNGQLRLSKRIDGAYTTEMIRQNSFKERVKDFL